MDGFFHSQSVQGSDVRVAPRFRSDSQRGDRTTAAGLRAAVLLEKVWHGADCGGKTAFSRSPFIAAGLVSDFRGFDCICYRAVFCARHGAAGLPVWTAGGSGPSEHMIDRLPSRMNGSVPSLAFLIYGQERLLRELLASLLAIRAGIHVAAHAGRAVAGVRACKEHSVDVLLLAVPSPGDGSLEVAREFVTRSPHGSVIVLSDPRRSLDQTDWLARKTVAVVGVNDAIQRLWAVIDGLVPAAHDGQEKRLRRRLGGRSLSQRESEVFALIGEGLTNAEISRRLALSDHTVRTHRKRIAAKLGTEGDDLTRWAIVSRQASLVSPRDA